MRGGLVERALFVSLRGPAMEAGLTAQVRTKVLADNLRDFWALPSGASPRRARACHALSALH